MKHRLPRDPGSEFDDLYGQTAARVEEQGGTPLPNDTKISRQDDDESEED